MNDEDQREEEDTKPHVVLEIQDIQVSSTAAIQGGNK